MVKFPSQSQFNLENNEMTQFFQPKCPRTVTVKVEAMNPESEALPGWENHLGAALTFALTGKTMVRLFAVTQAPPVLWPWLWAPSHAHSQLLLRVFLMKQ
jgi:hypothetical protein